MTKYNWDERHIITFPEKELALETKDLHVYYGQKEAIKGIDMQFEKNKITALIGPSGCGKSTFLRSLNRKARNQQQAVKDICIHIVNQQNAILRSLEQMNKEEQEK